MEIEIQFRAVRDDWYRANQLVPRLFRKALKTEAGIRFRGFPRQWIPVFEYFQMAWQDCEPPVEHMPIVSELSDQALVTHCQKARRAGTLRTLVESMAVLDPVLADFLYIIDNTTDYDPVSEPSKQPSCRQPIIRLTNWQSYGRPEVKRLVANVDEIPARKPIAVVLPCARQRPYQSSRTHRRVWRHLEPLGIDRASVHSIVVTSLAVVPEELFEDPVVLQYDAGVPDIYRTLRLARRFFSRNLYDEVIDCLQFAPYSDILEILHKEGRIGRLSRAPLSRSRQFYVRA